MAVVANGPFDDGPGILSDGLLHFYVVTDALGAPLTVSVDKHVALDTVRIGFDDGNPLSAPVDPQLSTVLAEPDSVPADGLALITIRIVPRDAGGVPLGSGLDVRLAAGGLWPGSLAGPIVDNGDGTYVARVRSSLPGVGQAWVAVEGVDLADEPALTYTEAGEASLREQAILRLENLTATGGIFDQLQDELEPGQAPGDEIAEALAATLDALAALYAFDDEDAISVDLTAAVTQLAQALNDAQGALADQIRGLLSHLLDSARLLALHHINEAEAGCGVCGQGGPDLLCAARKDFDKAEAERESAFAAAIRDYGKALDKASRSCP